MRRLWPVWYESAVSVLWAYTMVSIILFWGVSRLSGYVPYGASPIPNCWGVMIATACILQLFVGALMDRRYDKKILNSMLEVIYYPIIYWMLMMLITSIYTIDGFCRKRPQMQRWKIRREAA
jgi:poly-beta-1,6-N-acetyl-D-glucosamine synthase